LSLRQEIGHGMSSLLLGTCASKPQPEPGHALALEAVSRLPPLSPLLHAFLSREVVSADAARFVVATSASYWFCDRCGAECANQFG
jgi:hypothetical protein